MRGYKDNMISVIMPLYNEEKYLGYAIESVKNQLYKDWELIIIDDASTDGSLEIARGYASEDKRIKVISLNKNMGCCNALNVGIEASKGDYICWLSSDDEYMENMMSDCMEYFNDDIGAVIGRHRFYYQSTGREAQYTFDESFLENDADKRVEPYKTLFLCGNAFNACAVLMRREAVLKAGKFSLMHNYAGDYDFMMRMCAYSNVICVDKEFVKSRVHSEQVTFSQKNEIDAIKVFEEMLYNERERRLLLEKAHLVDCRKIIILAIKNRIKKYSTLKMEQEKNICETLLNECSTHIPELKQADEYCGLIKDDINKGDYEGALTRLNSMPVEIRDYADDELIGIFSAYIFLSYGERELEKQALESVYKANPLNYECNYLLAEYYAAEGEKIEAMQYYVNALRNSSVEDYDFIFKQFKKYINTIGD